MTDEQYRHFKKTVEDNGYKLWNVAKTIHNESFYYYKGFAYEGGYGRPGYQVLFLVLERGHMTNTPDNYAWGVTPLIITDSHDWSRIDLMITENDFSVQKVEDYAKDFYYNFVLTHGL